MFCPNCGTKISNKAKFCYHCGIKIEDYIDDETVATPNSVTEPEKKAVFEKESPSESDERPLENVLSDARLRDQLAEPHRDLTGIFDYNKDYHFRDIQQIFSARSQEEIDERKARAEQRDRVFADWAQRAENQKADDMDHAMEKLKGKLSVSEESLKEERQALHHYETGIARFKKISDAYREQGETVVHPFKRTKKTGQSDAAKMNDEPEVPAEKPSTPAPGRPFVFYKDVADREDAELKTSRENESSDRVPASDKGKESASATPRHHETSPMDVVKEEIGSAEKDGDKGASRPQEHLKDENKKGAATNGGQDEDKEKRMTMLEMLKKLAKQDRKVKNDGAEEGQEIHRAMEKAEEGGKKAVGSFLRRCDSLMMSLFESSNPLARRVAIPNSNARILTLVIFALATLLPLMLFIKDFSLLIGPFHVLGLYIMAIILALVLAVYRLAIHAVALRLAEMTMSKPIRITPLALIASTFVSIFELLVFLPRRSAIGLTNVLITGKWFGTVPAVEVVLILLSFFVLTVLTYGYVQKEKRVRFFVLTLIGLVSAVLILNGVFLLILRPGIRMIVPGLA